jgi:hypothetical protein
MAVASDHDIVEDAHAAEQRHILKCARDAEPGDATGREKRPILPIQENAPLGGMIDATDGIQERGLAGTVGANDGYDLALMDINTHPLERSQAAEPEMSILNLELGSTIILTRHICWLTRECWTTA